MEQFIEPIESYLIHQAFKAHIGCYRRIWNKCIQSSKQSRNMHFDADAGFYVDKKK